MKKVLGLCLFNCCLATAMFGADSFQKQPAKPVDLAGDKNLYVVGYAHLDTEWRWTYHTTTEDYIKAHPETVQKVVSSLQESLNMIYKDPQIAFRVGKKLYPNLSDKVIRAAVSHMLGENMYPRSAVVPDDLWQRTLKTRIDSGQLKKPQATNIAVDNDFALKARKDLGVTGP